MKEQTVFSTPWFALVAKMPPGYDAPHYSIQTKDYVSVVAITTDDRLVLVRQFRPAVETHTLELPSGHVEPGETPEQAARKELLEETGFVAEQLDYLGKCCPDTGRYGNQMWCYVAHGVVPTADLDHQAEAGIETVLFAGSLAELLEQADFACALNAAVLLLAVAKGHLQVR